MMRFVNTRPDSDPLTINDGDWAITDERPVQHLYCPDGSWQSALQLRGDERRGAGQWVYDLDDQI